MDCINFFVREQCQIKKKTVFSELQSVDVQRSWDEQANFIIEKRYNSIVELKRQRRVSKKNLFENTFGLYRRLCDSLHLIAQLLSSAAIDCRYIYYCNCLYLADIAVTIIDVTFRSFICRCSCYRRRLFIIFLLSP